MSAVVSGAAAGLRETRPRESELNQITQIVNRTRAPEIGSNVDPLD